MTDSRSSFSDRFGYRAPDAQITIREDAPGDIRSGILMLGYAAGIAPSSMREALCVTLLKRPDLNNWSSGNIEGEVSRLLDDAPWFKIYDFAERLYDEIGKSDFTQTQSLAFQQRLNRLFHEQGVGWQMENGLIKVRGSEAFELATRDAVEIMRAAGSSTAANEIHEALKDISRRPNADVTGGIQHAMAALECVAREYAGSSDTLGAIINTLPLPKPLDGALHKLWGFASTQGRHIQEGGEPTFENAELVVTVAAAVSVYLLRHKRANPSW